MCGCATPPVDWGLEDADYYDGAYIPDAKRETKTFADATPWLKDLLCSQDLFSETLQNLCVKPAHIGIISPENEVTTNTPLIPVSVQTQGLFIGGLSTYPIEFRVNGEPAAKSEKCLPSGAIADVPLKPGANLIAVQYSLFDSALQPTEMKEESIVVYYDPTLSTASQALIYQVTSPEDADKAGIAIIDPISGKAQGKIFPAVPNLEFFSIFDEACLLISQDAKQLYYVGRGGGAIISTSTHQTLAAFALPKDTAPEDCALSPEGKKLYLTGHTQPDLEGENLEELGPELLVVDLESKSVEQSLTLNAPWYTGASIAVHPLSGEIYLAILSQVSVIDPEMLEQIEAFPMTNWSNPGPIQISPDGVWGLATGSSYDGSDVTVFDALNYAVLDAFYFSPNFSEEVKGIAFSPWSEAAFLGDAFVAAYYYQKGSVTLTDPFVKAGLRVLTVPAEDAFQLYASNLNQAEEIACANLVELDPEEGTILRPLWGDRAFGRIVYKKPY